MENTEKYIIKESVLKKTIEGILSEEKTGKKEFTYKNEKQKRFVEALRKTLKKDKKLVEELKKYKKVI